MALHVQLIISHLSVSHLNAASCVRSTHPLPLPCRPMYHPPPSADKDATLSLVIEMGTAQTRTQSPALFQTE